MNIKLTKKRARLLVDARVGLRIRPEDVVLGTPVHARTYCRWEARKVKAVREKNLLPVLSRLGLSLEEFMAEKSKDARHETSPLAGEASLGSQPVDVVTAALQADRVLVSVLQAKRSALLSREVYQILLHGALGRRGFSVAEFTAMVGALDPARFHPQMTFEMEASLKQLRLFIGKRPVLTTDAPRLIWDCSCLPEALARALAERGYHSGRCTIHAHPESESLTTLMKRELIEMRYSGVGILWRYSKQFWPPSIDSFLTLRNLEAAGVTETGVRSVLDLGCGSGILGIALARRIASVRHLGLAEWLLVPLIYSGINARKNLQDLGVSWQLHLGMYADWVESSQGEPYDLVVCTPPYLPEGEGFEDVRGESPVAGTELLAFLLENRLGTVIYLTISSMVAEESRRLAASHRVVLEPVAEPVKVPFRVPAALRVPVYMKGLEDRGLLEYRPHDRFPFWHEITTFRVRSTRAH